MIRHLFKLVWNRRRTSALVAAEIFVSFLVVFATTAAAIYWAGNYRQPLGFVRDRVWDVAVDMKVHGDDTWTPEMSRTAEQLHLALRDLPEIESYGGALTPPYYQGSSQRASEWGGRLVRYEVNEVTDGLKDTLGLEIVRGRWFDDSDDAQPGLAVAINQKLAREAFGDGDPIGQRLPWDDSPHRIVGVFTDFRRGGEFSAPDFYLMQRVKLGDTAHRPPRHILVRVRPGVGVEFEQRLAETLQAVARDWSFEVTPLERLRADIFKFTVVPLVVASIVAAFMMLMVCLGLLGVLWQNVAQRAPEIGLRRAKGASARQVYAQIVGEVLVVTTVAAGAGLVLCAQIPLLGVLSFVGGGVFAAALAVSILIIYLLTSLCSLYPAWLAARVQPAEALHYD